jgi:uncharacterized protein (TIGR02246 family)
MHTHVPTFPAIALASGLAVALAGGCGPGSAESPLPDEVATSLETALTRNQPERCAEIFAPDAEIVPEDQPPVQGTEAIVAFCRELAAPELSFDTTRLLTLRRGDLAIEQGTYSVRNVREGTEVEYGQFLAVWKREGGEWRIYRSIYNTEAAPIGQTTVSEAEPPE